MDIEPGHDLPGNIRRGHGLEHKPALGKGVEHLGPKNGLDVILDRIGLGQKHPGPLTDLGFHNGVVMKIHDHGDADPQGKGKQHESGDEFHAKVYDFGTHRANYLSCSGGKINNVALNCKRGPAPGSPGPHTCKLKFPLQMSVKTGFFLKISGLSVFMGGGTGLAKFQDNVFFCPRDGGLNDSLN